MEFTYKLDNEIDLGFWQKKHAEELFALTDRNRKYLREWLPWVDGTQTAQDTADYIEIMLSNFAREEGLGVGIWYKKQLVGTIDLHAVNGNERKAEIGYWLDHEMNGRGIMTRACRAMLDYAFNTMKLNRVTIRAAVGNRKSRAIPERLGFKQEGIERDAQWLYDHYIDLVSYGMLAKDWHNNSEKGK